MCNRSFTNAAGRIGRIGSCVLLAGGILLLVLQPSTTVGQSAAGTMMKRPGPADDFVKLNLKFDGAQSCSNAKCHGADKPKEGAGATTLAEFTQWSAGDPPDRHAKAFETLGKDDSKAIAAKLKIADAATSARCTSCHALAVPDKLHGKQFSLEEGVTCNSCHGPSEKWASPHAQAGWTEKQRTALKTHDGFLAKWGLYDTKSPLARANKCTSCHLAIDADMVAAGHPQPVFELDYFSKSAAKGGIYDSQHWRDPKTPYYNASLWATGQAVCVRDAMLQLAERAGGAKPDAKAVNAAMNQAMAHYSVFKAVAGASAKAWDAPAMAMTAAAKGGKMADVAKNAKTVASEADKLAPSIAAMKFDRNKTFAVLKSLLKDPAPAQYGEKGMEQQAYAIYSLYNAFASTGGAATSKMIVDNLFADEKGNPPTAQKFAAGLKQIDAAVK
jgi:hypothetical protein